MTLWGYIIVLVALAGFMRLRPPVRRFRPVLAAFLFAAGFALTLVFLGFLQAQLWFAPRESLAPVLKNALLESRGARPQIVFAGSSQTYRNIDPEVFERATGGVLAVSNIAYDGMGTLEQDYYLRQFLDNAAKPPAILVLEVSRFSDAKPESGVVQEKKTRRAFLYNDRFHAPWLWRAVQAGSYGDEVLRKEVKSDILKNAFLRFFQTGMWRDAVPFFAVTPQEGYAPSQGQAREDARFNENVPPPDLPFARVQWVKGFRAAQIEYFKKAGVGKTVFLIPPNRQPANHGYGLVFCDYFPDIACIHAARTDVEGALSSSRMWQDRSHLSREGAEVYTRWLAGVLPLD